MLLSTAAASCVVTPRTLKIQGVIQAIEILILFDSGKSHSFLSEHLAPLLMGVSYVTTLHPNSEMLDVVWSIQGFQF
jgi:hypothetical protein